MDTIRQYIESIFAKMANTPETSKAKAHLLEMAEDKYQNLKDEGVSDNAAVAQVISEFGNLDELKEELGIASIVDENGEDLNARSISLSEVKDIVVDYRKAAYFSSAGIFFFIIAVTPSILFNDALGVALLFVFVAIGVVLNIVAHSFKTKWDFLSNTRCVLDMTTAEYIKEEKRRNSTGFVIAKCLGVFLCATSFVPIAIKESAWFSALLFVLTGLGVFCLVCSAKISRLYDLLLDVNPKHTFGGDYANGSNRIVYANPNLAAFMSIYWTLVSCLYICVSFLTFKWGLTWIIFIVGGLIKKAIEETKGVRE